MENQELNEFQELTGEQQEGLCGGLNAYQLLVRQSDFDVASQSAARDFLKKRVAVASQRLFTSASAVFGGSGGNGGAGGLFGTGGNGGTGGVGGFS